MISHTHRIRLAAIAALVLLAESLLVAQPAQAAGYFPITGSGSTWSQNALDQWRSNVARNYAMTVNYTGSGSSAGRTDYINGIVDFAISEIPFQPNPQDGSAPEHPTTKYAYMPIVAGGTSFMYNLKINGKRVTNLRLKGETIAKIFTSRITKWNDDEIQAQNPALKMPDRKITPVIRSDGSGTSAQFTLWMSKEFPSLWTTGMTSQFPIIGNAKAQKGSDGTSGYVAQNYGEGAITYVEYSYAKKAGFPVARVLNKAGYYTEPTAQSVAVALTYAKINTNEKSADYLTQILDETYDNTDKRSYPLSSYSYAIVPVEVQGIFTEDKGKTLGAFLRYVLCEGQQQADTLGYSPLPMNLVMAGSDQIKRIPGAGKAGVDTDSCNNPTFKKGDSPTKNRLAQTAPYPPACNLEGNTQCTNGTAGAPYDTVATGTGTGVHGEFTSAPSNDGGNSGGGNNNSGDGGNDNGSGGNNNGDGGNDNGSGNNDGGNNDGGGGNNNSDGGNNNSGGNNNGGNNDVPVYDENGQLLSNDPGSNNGDNSGSGGNGGNGGGTGGGGAVASAFTLPDPGMGTPQWLMLASAALLLAAVVVPPLVSRRLKASGGNA